MTTASVSVLVDGRPLAGALADALVHVVVDAKIDRPAQCRLTMLADSSAGPAVPPGATLVVRAADGGVLFDGTITATERAWQHDGVHTVTARATDRLAPLRDECRSGSESGDALAIAERVAARHGLELQTNQTAPGAPVTGQFGETDLALLRRLLGRSGLHLVVRGQVLHVFDLAGIGDAVDLRIGRELLSLSVDERADLHEAQVSVAGWSLDEATATSSGQHPQRTGWVLGPDAAGALSRAISDRRTQLRTVAEGVARGDSRLAPGCRVRVGAAEQLHEPLLVTEVEHRVDARRGHRTRFATGPIDPEPSRPAASWTLGEVVDVTDPQHAGRVMVALAAHGGQETHWLPVVLPGVGAGKGVVALPDVGDRVVVLGELDDPGTGLVLGGILGRTPVAGDPVVGDRTKRTVLRLPGGGTVEIDDDAGRIRVDNGRGSRLELGPDRALLHAAGDLEIAAPGKRLLLRAAAIDMEHAP